MNSVSANDPVSCPSGFGTKGAREQSSDHRVDVGASLEDCIDGCGDRHVDMVSDRERGKRRGGRHAFDDRFAGRENLGHRLAAADSDPEGIVAGGRARAAQRQIAEPGEAHHGLGLAATREAEPGHFGEPARDQGCARVLAKPAPGRDPAGDGEHVLDRAAELGAGNVIAAAGTSANLAPVSAYVDTLLPSADAAAFRAATFLKQWAADGVLEAV